MVLVVRCSLCGDILECAKSNRQALFDHIRCRHPQISLDTCENPTNKPKLGADSKCVLNEIIKEQDNDRTSKKRTSFNDPKRISIGNNTSPRRSSQCDVEKPSNRQQASTVGSDRDKRSCKIMSSADATGDRRCCNSQIPMITKKKNRSSKLYHTTVQKWRPGIAKIYCPKCGEIRRPIIKACQNRISKSAAGAACVLTCWPFCFLPFLFPPPTHENLHCRSCDFFLGVYDHRLEKTEPNNDAVLCGK